MIYERYTGRDSFVCLENTKEYEYTEIAPKAFLSCKGIQQLRLPASVKSVGDWAFAHMQSLTDLHLPAASISFGKKVFLDCDSLKCIHVQPDTSGNEGLPYFLGAAVTILQNTSLLQPQLAGSAQTHTEWMLLFDNALAAFLKSPDEQGFEPVFYGWFNDEDADSTQLPKYLFKRRSQKVYLSFLRLRYSLHLQEDLKRLLQEYLAAHMPGGSESDKHTITWDLLPQYYAQELCYMQILEQAGALTLETICALMEHLQDASAEVIAYLLRLQADKQESCSFFDNFSL